MYELREYQGDLGRLLTEQSSIYFCTVALFQSPGKVWVDDPYHITFALVYSDYQEGFEFMGKALETRQYRMLKEFFIDRIEPFMKEKGLDCFEYGADTPELLQMVRNVFSDKEIGSEKQAIFSFTGKSMQGKTLTKYEMTRIDSHLFERNLENPEYILEEICLSMGSLDNFLKNGYGMVALDQNRVIARALMEFTYGDRDNISVDTLEGYRKQGIASILAMEVIKHSLEQKQKPIWDCSEDNIASRKVAENVGFVVCREEDVCWFY